MKLRFALLAVLICCAAACSAGSVPPGTPPGAQDRSLHSNTINYCPDTGCTTGGGTGSTGAVITSRVMSASNCANMSSSPGCPSPAPTGSFAPSPGPLAFHGGPIVADYYHTPVLHAPPNTNRLFVDYWGWQSDPSGVRPYLHNFLSGLGGSSWLNTITQYSCNSCTDAPQILNNTGMLAGEYSNPSSAPTYVYTTSSWSSYKLLVGQEAAKDESYFGGFTDPAAIYVIALPPNHWDFSSGTCAVHGSYTDSSGNSVYWVL